jgi:hypothetical protein
LPSLHLLKVRSLRKTRSGSYRNKIADDDQGKELDQLINALARKSIITGQQSKQAKLAAHVRSKATHALWDEFDLHGVRDTIQITKQFLAAV